MTSSTACNEIQASRSSTHTDEGGLNPSPSTPRGGRLVPPAPTPMEKGPPPPPPTPRGSEQAPPTPTPREEGPKPPPPTPRGGSSLSTSLAPRGGVSASTLSWPEEGVAFPAAHILGREALAPNERGAPPGASDAMGRQRAPTPPIGDGQGWEACAVFFVRHAYTEVERHPRAVLRWHRFLAEGKMCSVRSVQRLS